MTMNFLKTLFFVLLLSTSVLARGLQEEFSWTRISYEWPSTQIRSSFPRKYQDSFVFPGNVNSDKRTTRRPGSLRPSSTTTRPSSPQESNNQSDEFYNYENNIPMGANVWENKLFITVPRRRLGVPSTLNYVWTNSSQRQNVPLIPYPDWQTNVLSGDSGSNGNKFVSIYRVAVDSCDRLWFVDTGIIETLGNPQQIQPSALVIMDLKTDQILHRHVFNSSLLRPASGLASVTVDITNNECDKAFAYIPDLGGYGLIVYDLSEDRSWRVSHNYFYLEPLAGEFRVGGHQFQWNDGIFSIAITDTKSDGYKDAYFHSMAGFNLYKVSTRILKNNTLATRSYHEDDFQVVGNRGKGSQTSSSDLDKSRGILFLALVNQNALGCWNIETPISDISIIQKNDQKMIYPSDVKVRGDTVVVLTNTMPVFLYGTLDYDQVNFRVWVEAIETAIKDTKCEKRRGARY